MTVDFRQTGDKPATESKVSATKSTVDFVDDLSTVSATVDFVSSVHTGYYFLILPCFATVVHNFSCAFNVQWNSCVNDVIIYLRKLHFDFLIQRCLSICPFCVYSAMLLSSLLGFFFCGCL